MPNFSGLWTERQQMQATGASTWPAVPGAPTIGTATAGSGSASVAFTAPSYTGYPSGITSYTATSSPGGFTGTGASSPITVSGLTNGTAYTFTVTATNATGTGPASAASNSVTPSANYIEDVFSTYLYTGNGSTQTITNNIDLSTNGGMVWLKARTSGGSSFTNNSIIDTARGANAYGYYSLYTNLTDSQFSPTGSGDAVATAVGTTGFTVGGNANVNYNTQTDVSWTFRKQPKFFDCGTFSGTGSVRTIAHSLGSVPGCIIVKKIDASDRDWIVYHRSLGATKYMALNQTYAQDTWSVVWNNTEPTSTEFTVGTFDGVNGSGFTYVWYAFAHNAGGFGLTGADNVISCGSYTGNGSATGPTVTLGWEPQWILIKRTDTSGQYWCMWDNMRGIVTGGNDPVLYPNVSDAENTGSEYLEVNATGFQLKNTFTAINASGSTYIYIAIRRGPMKVPTDGTKVYNAVKTNAASTPTTITFDTTLNGADWGWGTNLNNANRAYGGTSVFDRLRGSYYLFTNDTAAEGNSAGQGFSGETSWIRSFGSGDVVGHFFKRAPSFFDEVCYTGTGVTQNVSHNLTVAPELLITKNRTTGGINWFIYSSALGNNKVLNFDTSSANTSAATWNSTSPTTSVFTVGADTNANASGDKYVAYLFATCAGVSKVGSYTGTGATQTIDCGFAGGARFVLIKRTDSTGDWYVWDTARGMVSGTDPSLLLNSTAAEANANSVYTITTGFQIVSTAAGINASGGTYIYLAIA